MLFIGGGRVFTRFGVNRLQPQLSHQAANPLGIDTEAVLLGQGVPQAPAAPGRLIRVQLIDQPQQLEFKRLPLRVGLLLVIGRRAAQAQQFALTLNFGRLVVRLFVQHRPLSLHSQAQALLIFFSSS